MDGSLRVGLAILHAAHPPALCHAVTALRGGGFSDGSIFEMYARRCRFDRKWPCIACMFCTFWICFPRAVSSRGGARRTEGCKQNGSAALEVVCAVTGAGAGADSRRSAVVVSWSSSIGAWSTSGEGRDAGGTAGAGWNNWRDVGDDDEPGARGGLELFAGVPRAALRCSSVAVAVGDMKGLSVQAGADEGGGDEGSTCVTGVGGAGGVSDCCSCWGVVLDPDRRVT